MIQVKNENIATILSKLSSNIIRDYLNLNKNKKFINSYLGKVYK